MFSMRNLGGSRRVDRGLGKFQGATQMGTSSEQQQRFQGWTLRTWGAKVGMTQARDRFSLRVTDPNGLEIKYLSGFNTRAAAVQAGEQWVQRAVDGAEVRRRRLSAARTRHMKR